MNYGFDKYEYLDEVYEKAVKWLNSQGNWRGGKAMHNLSIGMNRFNTNGFSISNKDIENAIKIDVWYQLEPNLDRIVEYINNKMELNLE